MSGSAHAAKSAARVAGSAMSPATASIVTVDCARRFGRGVVEALPVAPVDHDVHAFARQRLRAREAKTRARRGDDRAPSRDPEIHQKSRSAGGAGPHWLIGSKQAVDAGRRVGREQVGVGPVLDGEAQRVLPVVEDLPAEHMASDSPVVLTLRREQVIVAGHEIVEVGDLPRAMTEPHLTRLDDQQRVVIGGLVSPVATHEATDRLVGRTEVDVVGGEQAERFGVPAGERGERRCLQRGVTEPLHLRRAGRDALQLADPRRARRRRCSGAWPRTSIGSAASMSATTSTTRPSGSVRCTTNPPPGSSSGSTAVPVCRGEPVEVGACRLEREAEERRLAEVGDVHVMIGVGAAHVQRGVGAGRGVHPERVEEGLHLVEIRRLEARERDVVGTDDRTRHGEIVRHRSFAVKIFCVEVLCAP